MDAEQHRMRERKREEKIILRKEVKMCVDCAFIIIFFCFFPYTSGTCESLFMPCNIKGNGDLWLYIRFFILVAIVNLQYLTILIKSEFQDSKIELWDKKVTNMVFTFFILSWKKACIVTKGHVCCNLVPTEFLYRGPYLFYCTFYKVMTHSILDSILQRMNIFNT